MNFDFANTGENLRLYNRNDLLVSSVNYDDSPSWPKTADGMGRTLELSNPAANLSDPLNWFAGCIGGSPAEAYSPCNEEIVFSEINYNSAPWLNAGDWVELRNTGEQAIDLSGWTFRDSKNYHCYDLNFTLNPGENRVLASEPDLFNTLFPDISNVEGPVGFALNSAEEALRLFDDEGKIYSSMVFYNTFPWPVEPDGQEFTLELLNEDASIADVNNWFAGCAQGSPGTYFIPCETEGITTLHDSGILVYPNPANEKLFVQIENMEGTYQLSLYDMLGNQIKNIERLSSSVEMVDISMLSKGMYLLVIRSDRASESRIVVKN
jgi:hypothetical protein